VGQSRDRWELYDTARRVVEALVSARVADRGKSTACDDQTPVDADNVIRFALDTLANDVSPRRRRVLAAMAAKLSVDHEAEHNEAILRATMVIGETAQVLLGVDGDLKAIKRQHFVGHDYLHRIDTDARTMSDDQRDEVIELLLTWVERKPVPGKHTSVGILAEICHRFGLLGFSRRKDLDEIRRAIKQAVSRASEGTDLVTSQGTDPVP
jgi:hypothetical protein